MPLQQKIIATCFENIECEQPFSYTVESGVLRDRRTTRSGRNDARQTALGKNYEH